MDELLLHGPPAGFLFSNGSPGVCLGTCRETRSVSFVSSSGHFIVSLFEGEMRDVVQGKCVSLVARKFDRCSFSPLHNFRNDWCVVIQDGEISTLQPYDAKRLPFVPREQTVTCISAFFSLPVVQLVVPIYRSSEFPISRGRLETVC